MKTPVKSQEGFTLIEVIITITIFAVIGVLAARTIDTSVKSKAKIQNQIDDLSRVRDALRLMERDLALALHYRDIEKEILDAAKQSTSSAPATPGFPPATPQPPQPQDQREAPRWDPTTHFVGSNEELNFVTMNNGRIIANMKQADFLEVGYALKECQGAAKGRCLWRRTSPVVDSDVTRGGDELVLLDSVEELKFRYLGRGKQDWVTEWKSDVGGDAATKNNFPWAVEISLTFKKAGNENSKKYSLQIVAPIHFPNNKEESSSGTTGTPAAATSRPPGT